MPARGVTYETLGISEFIKDLAAESPALTVELTKANRDTAVGVVFRARALAPRDTGDLQSAITFDGKGLNWRAGIDDRSYPSRGGNTAHQNPWVYGVWYEMGFVTRKIARHQYMGPAADIEDPLHEARVTAAVDRTLVK